MPREFGYAFAAVGVTALFVGPTMRLPLARKALFVSCAAELVCLAATPWFALIYPSGWTGPEGPVRVTDAGPARRESPKQLFAVRPNSYLYDS